MYDQFIWFTGVVEDRMDPLRLVGVRSGLWVSFT